MLERIAMVHSVNATIHVHGKVKRSNLAKFFGFITLNYH